MEVEHEHTYTLLRTFFYMLTILNMETAQNF